MKKKPKETVGKCADAQRKLSKGPKGPNGVGPESDLGRGQQNLHFAELTEAQNAVIHAALMAANRVQWWWWWWGCRGAGLVGGASDDGALG